MCFCTQLPFLLCILAHKLRFLQGEVVWTAERWGQVVCGRSGDGTRKNTFTYPYISYDTYGHTYFVMQFCCLSHCEQRNKQRKGSSICRERDWELWPWLYRGVLYKTRLLRFVQLYPKLCLETSTGLFGASEVWWLQSSWLSEWRQIDVEYWCQSCSFQKWKPDCWNNTGK